LESISCSAAAAGESALAPQHAPARAEKTVKAAKECHRRIRAKAGLKREKDRIMKKIGIAVEKTLVLAGSKIAENR
jgi:hypothetical protein